MSTTRRNFLKNGLLSLGALGLAPLLGKAPSCVETTDKTNVRGVNQNEDAFERRINTYARVCPSGEFQITRTPSITWIGLNEDPQL